MSVRKLPGQEKYRVRTGDTVRHFSTRARAENHLRRASSRGTQGVKGGTKLVSAPVQTGPERIATANTVRKARRSLPVTNKTKQAMRALYQQRQGYTPRAKSLHVTKRRTDRLPQRSATHTFDFKYLLQSCNALPQWHARMRRDEPFPQWTEYNDNDFRADTFTVNRKHFLTDGSYGEVFTAVLTDSNGRQTDTVVKVQPEVQHYRAGEQNKELWTEVLIHAHLFCATRDKLVRESLLQSLGINKKTFPTVPSIFTVGQFGKYDKQNAIVMENAGNMTLTQILTGLTGGVEGVYDFGDLELLSCIEQIAALLEVLQSKFKFMHRDLHTGNVMVRKSQGGYQAVLIDFGFSRGEFRVGSRQIALENADALDALNFGKSDCNFDHVGRTYDRST